MTKYIHRTNQPEIPHVLWSKATKAKLYRFTHIVAVAVAILPIAFGLPVLVWVD